MAELGHALGENRFEIRAPKSSAAFLPDGEARLERGHPLGELALPDQRNSSIPRRQDLGKQRQAVFATQPLRFFDTLEQLVGLTAKFEHDCVYYQSKTQIKRMPKPACMRIFNAGYLHGALWVAEHPGQ
jgi:hypothetical protein